MKRCRTKMCTKKFFLVQKDGLITMTIFGINFVIFDYDFLGEKNNFDLQTLQLFGDLYLVWVLRRKTR